MGWFSNTDNGFFLATIFPNATGRGTVLLDVGANAECKPKHLFEFAVMGSLYSSVILGIRNLTNLVDKLDCNLVRFTTAPGSAKRMAKYMLKRVGDVTWHYHAGIMTFPIRAAVQFAAAVLLQLCCLAGFVRCAG